ncbi:ATP synthase subunit I [Paenibacillus eucommiae]|uniref:ATP synthase protein I n=1 Tax=Paenibacillus eucommiae TaxID=1355755 RepID=A0ABS4IYC6_9BACL|nr:ATP synthase subunit I [Paenibacillus eucommiae]MBP1992586.1 ATP synthase protein I [Paenibacillus eucommiae]
MNTQLKPMVRITLLVVSVSLLVWIIFPSYRTYAAGLVLGVVISFINAWFLFMKIEALARNAAEGSDKRINLGFISRVCMAIIAVMIAVKIPDFNLVFTIIGLFFVQVATLLRGMFISNKD